MNKGICILNSKNWLILIAATPFLVLVLISGYYSDDLVNANIKGEVLLNGHTFTSYILSKINEISQLGRSSNFISTIISPIIYYVTQELVLHKLFVAVMLMICTYSIYNFLYKIGGSKNLGIISIFIFYCLIQFRLYHDPILNFGGIFLILASLLILSFLYFTRYLEEKKLKFLFLSVIFYNVCLYSYELNILYYGVFVLMAFLFFFKSPKKLFFSLILHTVSSFFWIIIYIKSKSTSTVVYQGNTINIDFIAILKTYFIQLLGSAPLSYYAFNPFNVFNHIGNINILFILPLTIVIFIILKKIPQSYNVKNKSIILVVGFYVFTVTPIAVSLSQKYQSELIFGLAYVPILIQNIGLAMLLAIAFLKIISIQSRYSFIYKNLMIFIISIIYSFNINLNYNVIGQYNLELKDQRELLKKSLTEGLLNGIVSNAHIIIDDRRDKNKDRFIYSHISGWYDIYNWKSSAFFMQYTGNNFKISKKPVSATDYYDFLQSNNDSVIYVIELTPDHVDSAGLFLQGHVSLKMLSNYSKAERLLNLEFREIRFFHPNSGVHNLKNIFIEKILISN